jgi:hypothetical protein
VNVQSFDDYQIRQFLERWYKYVLGLSPLPDQEQQELETLFTTLKENPRLRKLAENPLLLTVITGLYRSQRLPEKRVQVYDKCAELLLETWARLKGTNIRWSNMKMGREDQFACVAHLGFQLHLRSQEKNDAQDDRESTENTAIDVPAKVMRKEIERFLSKGKLITELAEQRKEAELFLRLMQEEAGLIVELGIDENGESVYGFVHRAFQEYFAAADIYERFEQDEDPTIIADFLIEYLHDPHWREVILLLLGKFGRKRATLRLRHILDGKIKSRRSLYTDILQQDLFFVCDCLLDEMDVESGLAETVVSRISNLVTTSPILQQRLNALEKLAGLMRTKQFANLGKRELVRLVALDTITDIELKIQIAKALYSSSPNGSEGRKLAVQRLLEMVQRLDLTAEQAVQAAQALYRSSSEGLEEKELATQQLLRIAQQPDITIEQSIQAVEVLYGSSLEGSEEKKLTAQQLLEIAQRPNLTVEQEIQAVQALYQSCARRSLEEGQQATQLLWRLSQDTRLTISQRLSVVTTPIAVSESCYKDKLRALQELCVLMPTEQIADYLDKHWPSGYYSQLEHEQVPDAVDFLKQELLSARVRDRIFDMLNGLIPQFNEISL